MITPHAGRSLVPVDVSENNGNVSLNYRSAVLRSLQKTKI